MRHFKRHPTITDNSMRRGGKARVGMATTNITVTDGPFTETKELLGSRTRLEPALPVNR
jgi:hypothetical protein